MEMVGKTVCRIKAIRAEPDDLTGTRPVVVPVTRVMLKTG